MAGKTLIGGTAYDVSGGQALVSGTSYSIKNGKALIGGTEYDIRFKAANGTIDVTDTMSIDDMTVNKIVYLEGYWIIVGSYVGSYGGTGFIAYTTSLEDSWTLVDIWYYANNTSYNSITSITYANGYWVVSGQYHDGSITGAAIAYATSLSSNWTTSVLWSSYSSSTNSNLLDDIVYANGYWVACGIRYSNSYHRIWTAYATSLSGSWTTVEHLSRSLSINVVRLRYVNGYRGLPNRKTSCHYGISVAQTTFSGESVLRSIYSRILRNSSANLKRMLILPFW